MTLQSAIYTGFVIHRRLRPKRHRFKYGVFTLLLDLDELKELDKRFLLFSYNRRGLISFYDGDHGPITGGSLRPWVESRMVEGGVLPDGGPIQLLCYPRILGYVFNPLSVYFCYKKNGNLASILYEVCNIQGERHTYIMPVKNPRRRVYRQVCKKALYVSPFVSMQMQYHFRTLPPGKSAIVVIREKDQEGLLLTASYNGRRCQLTGGALAKCLARFPFLCIKVTIGIHWEAFRMWLKGFPIFPHKPALSNVQSSVGQSKS